MSKQAAIQAYSIVPEKEEEEEVPPITVVGTAVEELDQPAPHLVPAEFANIPEAQGLSWKDAFFENDDDIVAVFDFDYEGLESYYRCLGWSCVGCSSFCFPATIPWMLIGFVPCMLNRNVTWSVRAKHIAVKRNGILLVHDRRPTCWGENYCTASKTTLFIPFEEISSCEIVEGNPKACGISNNLLRVAHRTVHTAHSGGFVQYIFGLENPEAFHKLVLSLKSGRHPASTTNRLAMVMEDRIAGATNSGDDVATVLREIRDELRANNEALRSLSAQPQPDRAVVQPSAPME